MKNAWLVTKLKRQLWTALQKKCNLDFTKTVNAAPQSHLLNDNFVIVGSNGFHDGTLLIRLPRVQANDFLYEITITLAPSTLY